MPLPLCISFQPLIPSHSKRCSVLFPVIGRRVSRLFLLRNSKGLSIEQQRHSRICSINGDLDGYKVSDANRTSLDDEGKEGIPQGQSFSSKEMLKRLKRYGISGILSYGLLNTAYYLTTFLLMWYYFAPSPGKMGYLAAVERFVKLMAMVWAGSQVTKLVRAAGALALAPLVDRGLSWFTIKFNFESQGKAFLAIVGCCLGLAIVLFFTVTLLSA